MGRPAKARDRLLDAAQDLLLARGYAATPLDRVCEAAGVSKGAIFYHFETKEDLVEAAVERFFQRLVSDGQDAVEASGAATATARLFAYIDAVAALTRTSALARGCLLGMVTMECAETNPPLADAAARAFDEWERSLASLIQEAASERGVEADATGLARAFLAAVEGGLLLDRHGDGHAHQGVEAALDHFRRYLTLVLRVGRETSA